MMLVSVAEVIFIDYEIAVSSSLDSSLLPDIFVLYFFLIFLA